MNSVSMKEVITLPPVLANVHPSTHTQRKAKQRQEDPQGQAGHMHPGEQAKPSCGESFYFKPHEDGLDSHLLRSGPAVLNFILLFLAVGKAAEFIFKAPDPLRIRACFTV